MEESKKIIVTRNLLEANRLIAEKIRKKCTEEGIFLVNIVSSPGSGKTTLLERIAEKMRDENIAVINADIETDRDRKRIEKKGVKAIQLETKGECHLEAYVIEQVMSELFGKGYRYVFIENIGNLICPTEFDIGEHLRVLLLSVPEGDDKPRKYPLAFRTSHALIISKIDLLKYLQYDIEKVEKEALFLNPDLRIFKISSVTGEGIEEFIKYLKDSRERCMS
jgi:hydrogenase nickel incorporation protein HypB